MSSQTDFLIVSHVDRTGPRIVLIETHVTTFFGDFFRIRFFQKKLQTIMELRALIIQTCNEMTEDMCRRVINITVRVEEVASGHTEHLIHRG
jgi:hypothetical protein